MSLQCESRYNVPHLLSSTSDDIVATVVAQHASFKKGDRPYASSPTFTEYRDYFTY